MRLTLNDQRSEPATWQFTFAPATVGGGVDPRGRQGVGPVAPFDGREEVEQE
jgi:hypothetical protein